jgi:hypothetical protein
MDAEKFATPEDRESSSSFQDTDAAEALSASTTTTAAIEPQIVMSTTNRLLIAGSIGVVIFMGALVSFTFTIANRSKAR